MAAAGAVAALLPSIVSWSEEADPFATAGEIVIAQAPEAVLGISCVVFSQDMRKVAYLANQNQGVTPKETVYLGDGHGPLFDFVNCDQQMKEGGLHAFRAGINSLTFSGDGSSFAYQARNAHENWRLVLDGKEHAGIKDDYHFSPAGGTIAAANCEGKQGCCWRTGKDVGKPRAEGETCPTLVEFAEDGKAVPVRYEFEGEKKRIVVGTTVGPWFGEITDFRLDPAGIHHSYVGCAKKDECVPVLDGKKAGPAYARILSLLPVHEAGTSILIARKGASGFVVNASGAEGPTFEYVTPPPVVDAQGRVFYIATQGEEKFAIVRQEGAKTLTTKSFPCIHLMRGEPGPKLSATYPYAPESPVVMSPDGKRFAFMACCSSCCRPGEGGSCKKAGCLSEGADFEMKVVVNGSAGSSIDKGSASKCYPPGSIHGFTWSPDGKKYAFALARGGSSSMFVGGKVVASRSGETFSDPVFTPDGGKVLFVSWKEKKGGGRKGRVYLGSTPISGEYDLVEWPPRLDAGKVAFNAVKGRAFLLVVLEME